jgi:hypothetical protein
MCVVYLKFQVLSTVLLFCHTLEVSLSTFAELYIDTVNVRVADQAYSVNKVSPLVGSGEALAPLVSVAEDPID